MIYTHDVNFTSGRPVFIIGLPKCRPSGAALRHVPHIDAVGVEFSSTEMGGVKSLDSHDGMVVVLGITLDADAVSARVTARECRRVIDTHNERVRRHISQVVGQCCSLGYICSGVYSPMLAIS